MCRKNLENLITNTPGAYTIEHKSTGLIYVGSTKNLRKRIKDHASALRTGKHRVERLQQAYNNDPNVHFGVIEDNTTRDHAYELEQDVINELSTNPCLLNSQKEAKWGKGSVYSDEVKKKISDSKKGTIRTNETRMKASITMLALCSSSDYKLPENSRPVRIDGIDYRSISNASKVLGFSKSSIVHRNELR